MTVIVEFIGANGGLGVCITPHGVLEITREGSCRVRLANGSLKAAYPRGRWLRASYVPVAED
jgi:hypothetical protein